MGDFVYKPHLITRFPSEAYDRFGLGDQTSPSDLMWHARRFSGLHRRLAYESFASVVSFQDSALSTIRLLPLDLQSDAADKSLGTPLLAHAALGRRIIDNAARRSRRFGTRVLYDAERNEGVLDLWSVRLQPLVGLDDAGADLSDVVTLETDRRETELPPSWPVYVINLANATSRWDSASSQLKQLDVVFERLPAIDGARLSPSEVSAVYDARRNRRMCKVPMTLEEIGCYLSHVAAWRRIVELSLPGGFVLEDDFIATAAFRSVVATIPSLPSGWDIIKLHSGQAARGRKIETLAAGHNLYEFLRVPIRTLGYAITRQAAARLIETSVPFARPIDIDHKHYWQLGLTIRGVFPSVLEVDPRYIATSTIGQARLRWRRQATLPERIARALRHLRDEARYQIGVCRRRPARTPMNPSAHVLDVIDRISTKAE
jgi:glycosyl transferase family 25